MDRLKNLLIKTIQPIMIYSLGMKQHLVIGMYMISNAKYRITDEISSGLDIDNRKCFFHQTMI